METSTTERRIRIAIADDHAVVRKGLTQIIQETPDLELMGEANDGQGLLEILSQTDLDVVLLDIAMPKKSGWEVIREIRFTYPEIKVIILSISSEEDFAIQFYKAGASGYLTKDSAQEELVDAIRRVAEGKKFVSPKFADLLVRHLNRDHQTPSHEQLSPREFQVFIRLAAGITLTQISSDLNLAVPTVGTYRARILSKMELENNAQLTKYAYQNHLLD